MAQERKIVFGALVETEDLPTALANIMAPGRLQGFDFEVADADMLRITPGSCLLPDGVLILEDENRELLVSNTSFPADYTIAYQLEDATLIGGSPAQLRLLPGILRQEAFTDGTVLGWIKYPGASIPLSEAHFIQPPPVRVEPRLGHLTQSFTAPFPEALRPQGEVQGTTTLKTTRQANLSTNFQSVHSYGGIHARILGATVVTDSVTITENASNYDTFTVKRTQTVTANTASGSPILANVSNVSRIFSGQGVTGPGIPAGTNVVSAVGTSVTISANATANATGALISFTDTIFSYDTRPTQQGEVQSGLPSGFLRASLPPDRFVLEPADTLRVENAVTMSPTPAAGEINIVAEIPATSGNWQESMVSYGDETAVQFTNIGALTTLYTFVLPFVISGEGQPRKLLSRLNVSFNTIVTFSILVDGQELTLSPVSGTAVNTASLTTREYIIPTLSTVEWRPGNTAKIEVEINAQPGGSAAFAHVSLSPDNAPFLVFV